MTSPESYAPSPVRAVREQAELIEESGGTQGVAIRGMPVILLTLRGARTGLIRKVPLMRVEHEGRYLAVGSDGGAAEDPKWVANLEANPRIVLQDGPDRYDLVARRLGGAERREWWDRAVDVFPYYAGYQAGTQRELPLFVLEPGQ